jgi:hypothetical protein
MVLVNINSKDHVALEIRFHKSTLSSPRTLISAVLAKAADKKRDLNHKF